MISLVGLPGSGKTTVGRNIARTLQRRFFDSDSEIERRTGKSVRALFEAEGETGFRALEQAVIAELVDLPDAIIATGGGSILYEANRQALSAHTTVVYLRSRPETIFRRLRHDNRRPLLQVTDPLRKLRDLYAERDPLYRATANFVFDCERSTVSMLAKLVLMQLELADMAHPPQPPTSPSGFHGT